MNRFTHLHRIIPMLVALFVLGQPNPIFAQSCTTCLTPAPPAFTFVPSDITTNVEPGGCLKMVNYSPALAEDCHGNPVAVIPNVSSVIFTAGVHTIVFSATDDCGTTTASFTITVLDNILPTPNCVPGTTTINIPAGGGSVALTAMDFDAGSSDNCGLPSRTISPSSVDCSNVGSSTVTLTVTDFGGNTASCTANISVVDNTPPTAACFPNGTQTITLLASGTNSVAALSLNSGSTDNCGGTLTYTAANGSGAFGSNFTVTCSDVPTATITLRVTDASGNSSTCSSVVNVEDLTAPMATAPANITLTCADVIPVTAPTVSDACGATPVLVEGTTKNINPATLGFYNYVITREWTVTDVNSNTTTVTQTITVEDYTAPTFNLTATSRQINANPGVSCLGTANLVITADSLSDNCAAFANLTLQMAIDYPVGLPDVATTAYNAASLVSFPIGTSVVTFTAADPVGNTATASVTITVRDAQGPVFTSPICGTTVNLNNVPGNCGNSFSWMRPGSNQIADCGTFTGDESISVAAIESSVEVSFGPYNANVPSQMVSAFFPVGTTNVGYVVTDQNSNTSSCAFSVVVTDTQVPVITCPANLTLSTTCPTDQVPSYLSSASITDNCSTGYNLSQMPKDTATLQYLFTGAPAQDSTFTVTITATDGAGSISCSFQVTLEDGNAPIPDVFQLTDVVDSCGTLVLLAPTATESCNPAGSVIYGTMTLPVATLLNTNPPSYQIEYSATATNNYVITWIYDDNNGNISTQTQNVTILPDTFPATPLCTSYTIQLNASGAATLSAADIDNGSFDQNGCGSVTLAVAPSAFTCNHVGDTTTVVLTVTDNAGNTSTCSTVVYTEDNVAPAFSATIANDTIIEACSAIPAAQVITATDACTPNLVVDFTSVSTQDTAGFGLYNYTITRTWAVADSNGNSQTGRQVVTVRDITPPSFGSAPTALSLATGPDAQGCQDEFVIDLSSFISDCTPYNKLVLSPANATFTGVLGLGTHTLTFTARDASNNTSSHTVVVTVSDGTPPIASCKNGISVSLSPSGSITIPASLVNNGSLDNCAGTLTFSPAQWTFTCDDIGTTNPPSVTLTVTDPSGNSASCTSFIEIQDNVAPSFTVCPADVTVQCDQSISTAVLGVAEADDNCSASITVTHNDNFVGSNGSTICGQVNRRWRATDGFGNTAICLQRIFIRDTIAPTLSATPANDTISCEMALPAAATLTATDNCSSNLAVAFVQDTTTIAGGACGLVQYTVRRTWTVSDDCGNETSHVQYIRVLDEKKPALVGLGDTLNYFTADIVGNTNCGLDISLDLSAYLSECADTSDMVASNNAPAGDGKFSLSGYYPVGAYQVAIYLEDACGNFVDDTITIVVSDNTTPQPDCIDQIVVALDNNGVGALLTAQVNLGSTDNCGVDTMYLTQNQFDCADLGTQAVEMVVVDDSGNENRCQFDVIVQQGAAATFSATVPNGRTTFFGAADGVLTATVTGGSGTFSYAWSTNATSATITGLAAGTYTVTVTDDQTNCQIVVTAQVVEGDRITLDIAEVSVPVGGMGNVPVTTASFNNVSQFTVQINVDTNTASFVQLVNVHPSMTGIFGLVQMGGSRFFVLWGSATQAPVTLPNGTVLFEIKVNGNGNGAVGQVTPVTFGPMGFGQTINSTFTGGIPGTGIPGSVTLSSATDMVLSGTVETWNNPQPVPNADVFNNAVQFGTTPANGTYSLSVPYASNTSVSLEKFTAGNVGVTTADLLRTANHILGNQPFTSPYQWVAADVTGEGDLAVTDIVKTQRLVLASVTHLDADPDWIFVPKSYVFPLDALSVPYPTSIDRTNVIQNYTADDFVAVRRGDTNGDTPTNLTSSTSDDRFDSEEVLVFRVADQTAKAGSVIRVAFGSPNFSQRAGYQGTIAFNPAVLKLKRTEAAALDLQDANFGTTRLNEGLLTTLFYQPKAMTLAAEQTAFVLEFEALKNVSSLADVLSFGSELTKAEAYTANFETTPVRLDFVKTTAAFDGFELDQNAPNPFQYSTRIGFTLPQEEAVTLRIYDATGRLVRSLQGQYGKGYHQIGLTAQDLGSPGVYRYELETSTHSDRKKLILFE